MPLFIKNPFNNPDFEINGDTISLRQFENGLNPLESAYQIALDGSQPDVKSVNDAFNTAVLEAVAKKENYSYFAPIVYEDPNAGDNVKWKSVLIIAGIGAILFYIMRKA